MIYCSVFFSAVSVINGGFCDTTAIDFKPAATECRVFDYDASQHESLPTSYQWDGLCIGGFATGAGELRAYLVGKIDEVTQGFMVKGKLEGTATTTFSDGAVFEGHYADGRRNGKGEDRDAKGNRYVGEYVNGQRNGRGTWTTASGTRYVGDWIDNKPWGVGIIQWPSGSQYEGAFVAGRRTGWAKQSFPNGLKVEGVFSDGVFVKGLITKPDGSEVGFTMADHR